ncbi:hypothetical protein BD410DRAFT_770589 [Rickenella mellea]|uniref:Sister chromatid cohesion protein n=1 Tax=Rickenella mellea TaxID=50990 RepID=A0A4Y7Q5A5_9AGAM|nr:hypothetical protein BD410DRAFT_770589 [Rickenella mellea]
MADNVNGAGWYPPQPSPNIDRSTATASSAQDAQRLLAVYPFASATPSTHVARHLGNLSITAAAPSYMQPAYYTPSSYSGNPPPYTEYADEVAQLSVPSIPQGGHQRVYWDAARQDASRYLGNQHANAYTNYHPTQSQWNTMPAPSSYQSPAFAQSLIGHSAPYNVYPTPPPPGMSTSSSSLANALGSPTPMISRVPPPPRTPLTLSNPVPAPVPPVEKKVYKPEESTAFFNNFLSETTHKINPQRQGLDVATPPSSPQVPQSSPDPLAMSSPYTPSTPMTPRKRKVEVVIETPLKRHQTSESSLTPITSPRPTSSTVKLNATPRKLSMQPFVELPSLPKSWSTPTASQKSLGKQRQRDGDDLGGYGSEDWSARRDAMYSGVRSSGKRTGDRDDRAPLEKLTGLFEDIFEAEDNLPADIQVTDLPSEFFSPFSTDTSRPLLHPNVIRKLTKYIGKVARPTKRLRLSFGRDGTVGTPRRTGGMAEVETNVLSRILKMLGRSVQAGENLEPFGYAKKKPTKSKKGGEDGRSKSPQGDTGENDTVEPEDKMDVEPEPAELTPEDISKLGIVLEIARDSIIAADCCIALLSSDRLTKQLYSEELITSCLATIKNQLSKLIYPFVETSTSGITNETPLLLQHVITKAPSASLSKLDYSNLDITTSRRYIGETFQALSAVLPRISNLVCADVVAMSDTIIIQAVYIAIGPFFVDSGGDGDGKGKKDSSAAVILSTLGSSAMRGLRLDALSLIRSIFANHEDQRSWIIEEILTSLIKLSDSKQKAGQFRLRDGRSIRTVSALLLQLVQTSAHGIRLEARRVSKARQQHSALKRQESMNGETEEPFLDDRDMEEIRLYSSGLEAPTKAAKSIVLFLTQRSGKSKTTKNTNEAEYRTILDNLISDLLVVLFWPEWPAAALVLGIICKFMITSLDDVKSVSQSDNNAFKAIGLDHLGVIAGRLRTAMMKYGRTDSERSSQSREEPLKSIDEVIMSLCSRQFERLVATHQDVSLHLCKRSSEDQAFESARELTAVIWGQELASALNQCNANLSDVEIESADSNAERKMLAFGTKIKLALRDVWKDPPTDVFDNATQEDVIRVDRLAEELGTIQSLKNAFDPILNVILVALDAPPVFMRTKALRALSQILTVDASVLSNQNVRRAIESHLLDSSPAVRDAAVELIGKYMVDSPAVAGDYYQKIAERIADTGLGVRKRVIKLLKSFYGVTEDLNRRVDISTRLVLRMLDEDDTVKDLAVKTLEELWFSNTSSSKALADTPEAKQQMASKVSVIMGVSGNFKDRQSPLEDVLHKIVTDEKADTSALHTMYTALCDTMIDGLVDASEFPGFSVVNCIKTVHIFATAYPAIISGTKASTLLPYLKNPTTPEEQMTSDYILKIFRASIPHMPKTAAKFGNDLQRVLQPMVVKPSPAAGLSALQETVACLCVVVRHLTHDYVRLVALLKSCNGRMAQFIKRSGPLPAQDLRALPMLVYIVSLLGEHSDFDHIRDEHKEIASELNSISEGPIIRHIYQSILMLYEKHTDQALRGRLLQCLGFLFRAQPTLMTLDSSATMMDAIFASPEEDNRGRLLKLMQEFLVSESEKHSHQEKGAKSTVNMEELVGNTHGFAESGVSSAVVQRYLDQIHEAALAVQPQVQSAAVDILSFTIKQGLAHPLQSFPVIIALETSTNVALSTRANALHSILHSKHASLLNAGYVKAARASFEYQKKIEQETVHGMDRGRWYRLEPAPTALLHRWYSLVREKRATRQDFLKAIVKVFDVDSDFKTSQDDVDFIRYMAENVASFDYKTQEETLTVIKYLTSTLSTSGMQLVEQISPSHLLNQLRGFAQSPRKQVNGDIVSAYSLYPCEDRFPLIRSSVAVGMIMLLKAHLKVLYGLTEEKCSKWVVGKKSAVGDRPATKRREVPISWDRMPFAVQPMLTNQDMDEQQTKFLEIWNEDGATVEPDPDEWE